MLHNIQNGFFKCKRACIRFCRHNGVLHNYDDDTVFLQHDFIGFKRVVKSCMQKKKKKCSERELHHENTSVDIYNYLKFIIVWKKYLKLMRLQVFTPEILCYSYQQIINAEMQNYLIKCKLEASRAWKYLYGENKLNVLLMNVHLKTIKTFTVFQVMHVSCQQLDIIKEHVCCLAIIRNTQ